MNHRFLGKCRRGSARSTASKWRLPITQSSDLNMTYIIAFCGGSVVEHHITTQKKKKKPESCPDLRGHTLSYNSHIAFMVKVFARIRESRLDRPQNYIHNWKWNIKCHIFLWFNLKSNHHYHDSKSGIRGSSKGTKMYLIIHVSHSK